MRAAVLVWIGAVVLALDLVAFTPVGGPSVAGQGATSQMRRDLVRQLAAGKLLVATRGLPDPNFSATVVLLADFDRNGAMGLILNRQTDVPLARLFPDLPAPSIREMNAFFGGPVPADGVLALVRSNRAHTDIPRVVGDVYLVSTREMLDQVIADGVRPDDLRVFVGYAGWGPGQLDSETGQGAWHLLDGSGAVIFDPAPDTLWERQIRRTEALSAKFTSGSGGPAQATSGRAQQSRPLRSVHPAAR